MPVVINGDTGITQAGEFDSDSSFGFKNRVINGGMVIDQRNAGASVTQTTSLLYTVDRFAIVGSVTSKFTAQQSTTAATGFSNSLLCTSSSAYTVGASEDFTVRHYIEGFNAADLGWGTANASAVTLSFWVRSSLTGTFGGSIANSAQDRFYVFSYTISAANTWEQKTITISGDTAGTWVTNNGIGIRIFWSLGAGATVSGTAGSWGTTLYRSVTGATSVVGTNGATFYITGLQLERGSTATSFDFRSYGTELALCQRYYEKSFPIGTVPANGGSATTLSTNDGSVSGLAQNRLNAGPTVQFKVTKRTAPTMTKFGNSGGDWIYGLQGSTALVGSANSGLIRISENAFTVDQQAIDATAIFILGHWTASAEL